MNEIDLHNKVISCKDIDILGFFFPNHIVRDELQLDDISEDILYIGKYRVGILDELEYGSRSYISIVGKPDYDLNTREGMLEFAYSRHGKSIPKKVSGGDSDISLYEGLSDEEFIGVVKHVWVMGVYPYSIGAEGVYGLFKALLGTRGDIFEALHSVRKFYRDFEICSMLVGMFIKSLSLDNIVVSTAYRILLGNIIKRYGEGRIRSLLLRVGTSRVDRDHLLYYILSMIIN